MVGVSGSNKLSLYVIATEILMVQACVDQSHRRNAYCSTAVDQSYRRRAYCSAVPQRTICTLQQNSVRLYQVRERPSVSPFRAGHAPHTELQSGGIYLMMGMKQILRMHIFIFVFFNG